jgi:glycerol-3-phosphate acyltransferase PlsX
MGAVFAQHRLGIKEPRVALLSIGEEPGKGSPLIKESFESFSTADFNGGSFIGNIEGRDLLTDAVDVAVADGFTGNVALKTIEGTMKTFFSTMLEKMTSRPEAASALEILEPEFAELFELFHPDTYGGAMLLGVKGVCIISHGSSGALAIENAIKVAAEMAEVDIVGSIKSSFNQSN